jgi:ribosomal protein L11 methyltransferase
MEEGSTYYYEFTIEISSPKLEQLIYCLDKLGFNGYLEEEGGIKAYIDAQHFGSDAFWSLIHQLGIAEEAVHVQHLPHQNWNKNWEAHFEPQRIDDQVLVRAPFHSHNGSHRYELVIEPQMAFGTGYHATTRMMIKLMLGLPYTPDRVFDFGTGSGILAILAEKMGATRIFGNEIQEDGLRNALNNISHNSCQCITLSQEDLKNFPPFGENFELILANINRNTIIASLPVLRQRLTNNGWIGVSGFFSREAAQVDEQFHQHGFERVNHLEEGAWAASLFTSTFA